MTLRLRLVCAASTSATRAVGFPADEPLDPLTARKLEGLADRVRPANRIWSSPALRAMQTARALGLAAVVEPDLRDWDYGRWSGKTLSDVQAREPEAVAAWIGDPAGAPHGGEALVDVLARAAAWLAGQAGSEGHVVAVSHAAVIRALIVSAIAATPSTFWHLDIAPLSVTKLNYGHRRWSLSSLGPIVARNGTARPGRPEPGAVPAARLDRDRRPT